MKKAFLLLAGLGLLASAAPLAAFEDDGLSEAAVSTDAVKNGDEDETQPLIQESDEDLAAFVTDYITKDIQLKGAFLLEDKPAQKVLKLKLASVEQKSSNGDNDVKKIKALFKDAAGKKYTIIFHVRRGTWGDLDIFKIEIAPAAPAAAKTGR